MIPNEKYTMWAVVTNEKNWILDWTAKYRRRDAIQAYLNTRVLKGKTWRQVKKENNVSVKKITVTYTIVEQ